MRWRGREAGREGGVVGGLLGRCGCVRLIGMALRVVASLICPAAWTTVFTSLVVDIYIPIEKMTANPAAYTIKPRFIHFPLLLPVYA